LGLMISKAIEGVGRSLSKKSRAEIPERTSTRYSEAHASLQDDSIITSVLGNCHIKNLRYSQDSYSRNSGFVKFRVLKTARSLQKAATGAKSGAVVLRVLPTCTASRQIPVSLLCFPLPGIHSLRSLR
jgi:hypothetical protein